MADEGERSADEARFRTILEHAPVMIDSFGPDGSVLIWNRECERRLGWTAEEVAAMEDPLAAFYPDEDVRAEAGDAIRRADGKFREYEVRAKDGSKRTQMWADFRLPNGEQISVGHDISEQREVEAQLRQAQKMEALGNLSGGIGHDFNNLLTIILSAVTLGLRDVGKNPEAVRETLEEIRAAAQRGAELVGRIMSFSRRRDLSMRPLVVDETFADFVPALRRLVPESLELHLALGAPAVATMADPVALEQVLVNLVTNARDAIVGRGRISIRTAREAMPARSDTPNRDAVRVTVSDTGTGMSPEVARSALEPFFTTKDLGTGTGLGLSMVDGIIDQHGGFLELRTEPGQGTSVTFWLPLADVDVRPAEPPKASGVEVDDGAPVGRGEVVLVVEDEANVARFAKRALEAEGFEVHTASDGEQALSLLAGGLKVDLVISDVIMPRMTGEELRRRLADSGAEGVPIVFTSGYAPADIPLPPDARVLPKPWRPAELAAFVREALDRDRGT